MFAETQCLHQETSVSSSNTFLEHLEWHAIHLPLLAVVWFTQRDVTDITLESCGVLLFYGSIVAIIAWSWIRKLCERINNFIMRNAEEPPFAQTVILKCGHCQWQGPMIPVSCHLYGFSDFHMSSKEWLFDPAWLCASLDTAFFKYVSAISLVFVTLVFG